MERLKEKEENAKLIMRSPIVQKMLPPKNLFVLSCQPHLICIERGYKEMAAVHSVSGHGRVGTLCSTLGQTAV